MAVTVRAARHRPVLCHTLSPPSHEKCSTGQLLGGTSTAMNNFLLVLAKR